MFVHKKDGKEQFNFNSIQFYYSHFSRRLNLFFEEKRRKSLCGKSYSEV